MDTVPLGDDLGIEASTGLKERLAPYLDQAHAVVLDATEVRRVHTAGLQVLCALREAGGDLTALLGQMELYPQLLINVPLVKGFAWKDHPLIVGVLREVELSLEGEGRVRALTLLPDHLSREEFRMLRIWLRWHSAASARGASIS